MPSVSAVGCARATGPKWVTLPMRRSRNCARLAQRTVPRRKDRREIATMRSPGMSSAVTPPKGTRSPITASRIRSCRHSTRRTSSTKSRKPLRTSANNSVRSTRFRWRRHTASTIRAYLDYVKEHESHMWIATFQDGAKYARERVNSSVKSNVNGDAIEVSVTHSLKPDVYDIPLTARTTIPADWRLVRFRQGDDVRW